MARTIQVVGHRGAAALAPENTIAAFARGADAGVDTVELDVQRTRDGIPVVLHDDTLDRTTNGEGALAAHDWAALRELDAGSWFAPELAGERIPSLAQVCEWAATREIGLSIELKQPEPARGIARDEGLVPAVLAVLAGRGLEERVVLHSFDHPSIAQALAISPRSTTALLYGGPNLADPLAIARTVPGIRGLHVRWQWVSRELCRAARAEGLYVHAYAMPEPVRREIVLRLVDFGVDSLSADDPRPLLALLAAEGLRP